MAVSGLSSLVSHGDTVYGMVTCLNNAGLSSVGVSDGATILVDPPNHQLASVTVTSPTLMLFESRSGYVHSDLLLIYWSGFQDSSDAPLQYQVRVSESSEGDTEGGWMEVGSLRQVTLDNVTLLANASHTVQVRAYVVEGLVSEPANGVFFINNIPPQTTEGTVVCVYVTTSICFVCRPSLWLLLGIY